MDEIRGKFGIVPSLVLGVLLLVAQGSALAHAYKHDVGSPQGQTCAGCVAANQLASACVDNPAANVVQPCLPQHHATQEQVFESAHEVTVRQRGPPTLI